MKIFRSIFKTGVILQMIMHWNISFAQFDYSIFGEGYSAKQLDSINEIYNPILNPYKGIEFCIEPQKGVFTQNDTAFFLFKLINNSDSIFYLHKYHRIAEDFNHELRKLTFTQEDIHLDLLRETDNGYVKQFIPYTTTMDYRIYSLIDLKYRDYIIDSLEAELGDSLKDGIVAETWYKYLNKLRIIENSNYLKLDCLNPHDSIMFFINLFPFKELFPPGKYMVMANIKVNINDSFFIIRSNWTKFDFR